MNRDIAILIPCYNEAQTIAKVVADAKKNVPEATVYVYDNNSIDGSGKLAQEAGATVIPEPKQGKGNVVRSMFRNIEAEHYFLQPCSCQNTEEVIRYILDHPHWRLSLQTHKLIGIQ